jgi:diguanylate cyclase
MGEGGTREPASVVRGVLRVYAPFVAVAMLWGLAWMAGYRGVRFMAWLPGVAAMTLAAWFLYRASGAPGLAPAGRRFWRRLAVAALLIAPATAPMPHGRVVAPQMPAGLIAALALIVVALLLVLWSLLRLPARRRSRGDWVRLGLDGATVLVAAATFLWYFMLRPVTGPGVDPRMLLGFLVLCLVCLLAVLAVVKLMLAGTDAVAGASLRTLAVTVLAGAATASFTPLFDEVRMAGVSGVSTTVEAMLAALAGAVQLDQAARAARGAAKRRRPYSLLPYVAVAAIDGLLLAVTARLGAGSGFVVVGAVIATAIVVIRQLLAFRDNDTLVGSLREYQARLREQATHDPLTGLANRALFNETLAEAYATDQPLTALLVDLDDFKPVNDTHGHAVGDGLLIEVGQRLRRAVGDGGLPARLGGDEFAVLLPGVAGDDADKVAARIVAEIAAPVVTHGHRLAVGASIGVAGRCAGDDPQALIHHADLALYAAKGRGKGHYARYGTDVPAPAAPGPVTFEQVLDLAGRGVVDVATSLDGGRSLAEVCAAAAAEHPGTPLSVRVDHKRLRNAAFVAEVGAALARYGRPAEHFTLVVAAPVDLAGAEPALRQLRAAGVRLGLHVAADGPVTLAAMLALPLSRVSVDVSFLTGATEDPGASRRRIAVARGLARMAGEAGLECVAVGAADGAQVRELGYPLAQGLVREPAGTSA